MKIRTLFVAYGIAAGTPGSFLLAEEASVIPEGEYRYLGDGETLARTTVVEGQLRKRGDGDTRVPLAKVDGRGSILVPSGSLTLVDGGESFAPQVPTSVLSKAATWLDASREEAVQLVAGSQENVHQWLDARETATAERGESGAYAYFHWMAHTNLPHSATAIAAGPDRWFPTYCAKSADHPANVNFGGWASGQNLRCVNAKGESCTIPSVTWVFVVYGSFDNRWGFVLGTDNASFVPSGYGWEQEYHEILASTSMGNDRVRTERFRLDGVVVDPFSEKLRAGYHLLSFPTGAEDFNLQHFFNDRDNANASSGYRQGGGRLCEVVVYTCALSEAERTAVENYLVRKWVEPSSSAPKAVTARGASVVCEIGEGCSRQLAVCGGGTLVKQGKGTAVGSPVNGREPTTLQTVSLVDGTVDFARSTALVSVDATEYCATTAGVVRSAHTDGSALIKSGDGDMAVRSLSEAVRKIDVRGGTLRLMRGATGDSYSLPASLEGQLADPSFESFADQGIAEDGSMTPTAETHGWRSVQPHTTSGNGQVVRWKNANGNYNQVGVRYPDGNYAGLLHLDGGLETSFALEADGIYELSFWATQRTTYSGGEFRVQVDGVDIAQVQTVGGMKFRKYVFRLPWLTSGRHVLAFLADANNSKATSGLSSNYVCMFDDVHIDWVSSENPSAGVGNGGFELYAFQKGSTIGKNALEGWTVSEHDSQSNFVLLFGPDSTSTSVFNVNVSMNEIPEGARALMVCGKPAIQGQLRFDKPGRYALRARVGFIRPTGGGDAGLPKPVLKFAVGDALLEKSVTPTARGWFADTQIGTFEVSGDHVSSGVQLKIAGTVANGVALLDDIRLELVDTADGAIVNSFSAEGWTAFETPSDIHDGSGKVTWLVDADDKDAWGKVCYDDVFRVAVRNQGVIYRTERLKAGQYRLTVASIGRFYRNGVPDPDKLCRYGQNRFAAWIGTADGSITNRIGEFSTDTRERWRTNQFLFEVPVEGDYRIGFSGLCTSDKAYDGTTLGSHGGLLDGLVIERVTFDPPDPLDQVIEVNVSEGAKLALDNLSTNKVSVVVLGGRRRSGLITAERFPAYITGRGALFADPKGLSIIVR